ncbi:37666_t:CDS:2 [Gigaspora margarita]|uniref:37666_t:CDS:1 n=1 Tax=Gigaspora margarita TaxID=4874 RepID=A0ABN7WB62_GIGMA|nr:37666_t:CDS:2 [Gigaspora margarita]
MAPGWAAQVTKNNKKSTKKLKQTKKTTKKLKANKRKQLNASLKDYVTKLFTKDSTSNKKHNANKEENSLEWAIPITRPKKIINETALAIKKHSTTDFNDKITENAKTKMLVFKKQVQKEKLS